MNQPLFPHPHGLLPDRGDPATLPVIAVDLPVMYEDEGQDEVGETDLHWRCCEILRNGFLAHLAHRPEGYRVFADLNVYYHYVDRWAYVTPDACVVIPLRPLPDVVSSYRVGTQGPAPVLVAEVLSRRSGQQQDLGSKLEIYARLGIPEYLIVDVTGEYLPRKLLLKRLVPADEVWADEQDHDGGVTSQLGCRVVLDADGMLRVLDARTGKRYPRPEEAFAIDEERLRAMEEKRLAEERVRQLEEENARLRGGSPPSPP